MMTPRRYSLLFIFTLLALIGGGVFIDNTKGADAFLISKFSISFDYPFAKLPPAWIGVWQNERTTTTITAAEHNHRGTWCIQRASRAGRPCRSFTLFSRKGGQVIFIIEQTRPAATFSPPPPPPPLLASLSFVRKFVRSYVRLFFLFSRIRLILSLSFFLFSLSSRWGKNPRWLPRWPVPPSQLNAGEIFFLLKERGGCCYCCYMCVPLTQQQQRTRTSIDQKRLKGPLFFLFPATFHHLTLKQLKFQLNLIALQGFTRGKE